MGRTWKGKRKEVPEAKKKLQMKQNNMIRSNKQGRTLHHDIKEIWFWVYLRTAPSGTGVIAGGPMRAVLKL